MLVVMLIGVLLGVLRKRTSTTVCIAVHALYDVAAIFST
jgi:membrane protease YdiL (CAAX protease family)